jgi:hypothetical protein
MKAGPDRFGCRGATLLSAARLLLGTLYLFAPERSSEALGACCQSRGARAAVRLLGARHLLQAAVSGRRPARGTLGAGAAVDAAHALSMLAIAFVSPRSRRPALSSAAVAGTLALAGLFAMAGVPEGSC